LLKLVPQNMAFRYHTAVIQHGRLTCKAPKPDCAQCAVADMCASAPVT
jgi:endonuclease-3